MEPQAFVFFTISRKSPIVALFVALCSGVFSKEIDFMSEKKSGTNNKKKPTSCFTVGKVHAYLRGRIWYLRYSKNGLRKQSRVGPDRDHARQMAAKINSQLENSVPSTLGFESLTIIELRNRWPGRHEDVRRSSLSTISRYRIATEYLIRFLTSECRHLVDAIQLIQPAPSVAVTLNGTAPGVD
jgi:hypothetical protein